MGNVIRAKDIHHDVKFEYYGLGKLKSRNEGGRTIHFDYDKEEQLHTIRNEKGEAYHFELDALGNVITETGFDDLVRKYHRDPAGRVLKVQRPTVDGVKRFTNYNYDSIGNVVAVEHHDKTWQNYDYDGDGNLIIAENEHAKVQLKRNSAGQVEKEYQIFDGETYEISSEYDNFGDRIGIKSSLGADIRHERNNLGDVMKTQASPLTPGGGIWEADFQRDILGLEIHRQLTGDVNISTKRDSLGRVLKHEVRSGANRTRSKSYQWQPNNRLKNIVDNIKSETKEFNYDSFGNLVSCKTGDEYDYFFRDEVGNIFKDKALKGRKYEKGGRIEESETHEFFYDDEGNLTSKRTKDWKQHWHYEWNGDGSLKAVKRPDGGLVEFKYDALGRRTEKKYSPKNDAQGIKTTKFVWDGNTPLHEWVEQTESRPLTAESLTTWVFDADSFVPSAKIQGEKSYSIVSDYLGTPCQAYDANGGKVWEYEQKSYGGIENLQGQINFIPFRFQGQYEDVETGLYYNRFRYYSPEEGSYISQDPIRLNGGLSLYGYVHDTNEYFDKFGLQKDKLSAKDLKDLYGNKNQTVYGIYEGDKIVYVGITDDFDRRQKDHGKIEKGQSEARLNGKREMKPLDIPNNGKLTKAEARGWEQAKIEEHKTLGKNLPGNRQNSFDKNRTDTRGKAYKEEYDKIQNEHYNH